MSGPPGISKAYGIVRTNLSDQWGNYTTDIPSPLGKTTSGITRYKFRQKVQEVRESGISQVEWEPRLHDRRTQTGPTPWENLYHGSGEVPEASSVGWQGFDGRPHPQA